jgi:hypothetical protein
MKARYLRFILWGREEITIRIDRSKEKKATEIFFEVARYDKLLSPTEKAKLFVEYRVQNNSDYAQHLLREANIEYELVNIVDYVVE